MSYILKHTSGKNLISIPKIITDSHLRLYTSDQLKVILWIYGNQSKSIEIRTIAKELRISEENVDDALMYWAMAGILEEGQTDGFTEPVKFIPGPKKENNSKSETESKPKFSMEAQIPSKPSQAEILKRIEESPEIGALFTEAQMILGKTIGYDGQCTFILLHDHYGLPIEVIFMLLDYCVSVNKTNYAYVEAVGKDWGLKEIDTIEKAAEKITALKNVNSVWSEFSEYTGITTPKPTAKQSEYLDCWLNEWKFTMKSIFMAYDDSAEHTGKLSFSYMNKILQRWYTEGKTEGQAKPTSKAKSTSASAGTDASYDLDKFKDKVRSGIKYERKGKK